METGNKTIRAHRKIFCGVIVVLAVFIGCCGFPVFNLTKQFSTWITILNIVACLAFYTEIGKIMGILFPNQHISYILLGNGILTFLGMGCRFLLEFGEVSNTYNFTALNVLLHLLVATLISTHFWHATAKREANQEK